MKQKTISFNLIKQSAERIARALHPKKIILFGSYAHGRPHRDSDVDLLIVLKEKRKTHHRYEEVSKLLEPRTFPVDLLVRTSREIRHRLKIGDTFIQDILGRGKVLYES